MEKKNVFAYCVNARLTRLATSSELKRLQTRVPIRGGKSSKNGGRGRARWRVLMQFKRDAAFSSFLF